MKTPLFLILILLSFSSCVTKKGIENKVESPTTTTTTTSSTIQTIKAEQISNDDLLFIFNRLIKFIKDRDIDGILSCYTEEAIFLYDKDTPKKLVCFDNEKEVYGKNDLSKQYKYMFKTRILDNIEFEIYEINKNIANPMIKFINAWQNSDYDVEERIFFAKENGIYKINRHIVGKKNYE